MTWIAALFALALGLVLGALLAARHADELHADNARLRNALRYVRGAALRHPELARLRAYIERALDEEVGA